MDGHWEARKCSHDAPLRCDESTDQRASWASRLHPKLRQMMIQMFVEHVVPLGRGKRAKRV